jgi:nicotinate-nucleotide adenylyltransferase
MKIGLFGGTFDPIHLGHIALARAAMEQCKLQKILFVPASVPPHKQEQALSPFIHRFAMLTLATADEKAFVPSLLEAPAEDANDRHANGRRDRKLKPNYSVDTVRRLRQSLKPSEQIYFLIGIDAFAEISNWHEPEHLFRECEFIVAGRPGYSLADVAKALPEKLRPREEVMKPFQRHPAAGDLVLPGATIHLLGDLRQPASATAIREAVAGGKSLGRFLDPRVAEYIRKMGLYKSAS